VAFNPGRLILELLAWFLAFATAGGFICPEEGLVIGAGGWAAMNPQYGPFRWLILPVIWTGVVVSDGLFYAAGRHYGDRLFQFKFVARFYPAEKRQRVEENFQRYGVIILLFGRVVPGIRLPLFLTAGMMRLSVPAFLLSDFLGTFVGSTLVFFLAYWVGTEVLQAWESEFKQYQSWLILGLILCVMIYLLLEFLRRPYRTGDPEEVPLIGHQVAVHLPTHPVAEQKHPSLNTPALQQPESRTGISKAQSGTPESPEVIP
jgi:membrane protein DedA with SNARE-associated domain